jgi:anti-sigma factor RsiW
MEHSEIQQLLPAYVDQELGIVDALAVERHLETCQACRHDVDEQRSVSTRVRTGAVYADAPAALRARIIAGLPASQPVRPRTAWLQSWWTPAAAGLAFLLVLAWGVNAYRAIPTPQQRLAEELLADHVRSLQVDHLTDVASSDQHTVKPWFIGKLDFAPPVVDLAPQGFPLTGGRLDYLENRNVAVLVYHRYRHPINLYVWPGAELPATPQSSTTQGYHLVRWSKGGMNYSAVSDVAESDLMQFVALLRQ